VAAPGHGADPHALSRRDSSVLADRNRRRRGARRIRSRAMADPQDATPAAGRALQINEDWLAVIVGLALLALVLVGALPGSVIP